MNRKPNRRERTAKARERKAAGLPVPAPTPPKARRPDRVPTHGTVPSEAEGWVCQQPTADPELYIARIVTVRFDDCSVERYYLMQVRPAVVKAKRTLLKKKLRELSHAVRDAEKREERQRKLEVRALLAMMGR